MSLSAIDHLYAFDDGDTITPAMGIVWENGETNLGLQQYWNPSTEKVIATDFKLHHASLYPRPYSSKEGTIIVPEAAGQQWYYNNPESEAAAILDDNGKVKTKFASLFAVKTIEQNGKIFPALKIIDNLATKEDHTDKYIYYKSTYGGKSFTCQQLIPIQESVGDSYKVLVSTTGADGSGDNVLSSDNDWVQFSASLQRAGVDVSGAAYQWQRNTVTGWENISSVESLITANGSVLKVWAAGIEGTEMYRCLVTYNTKNYYGFAEATDIHDPLYVELNRSTPSQFIDPGQTVSYDPKVRERATGELSTEKWKFTFFFKDKNGSNVSVTDNKPTYNVIKKSGSLAVSVLADKTK